MTIAVLCAFGFFASLVDAVVGGGGLISVPALLIFLPGAPPPVVLATNKFSSTFGSAAAVARYALSGKIVWPVAIPAGIAGFAFAILGARAVSLLDQALMRPLILVLLALVATVVLFNRDMGAEHRPTLSKRWSFLASVLLGATLGFYEGFFGPGTGSFLVFALVGLYGFDFLAAGATGRVINFAATAAALLYFVAAGLVRYDVAVPMAASTMLGGVVGSRLAIRHGSRFIRGLFLLVACVLLARLTFDMFKN